MCFESKLQKSQLFGVTFVYYTGTIQVEIPPPRDANLKKTMQQLLFYSLVTYFLFRGGWHLSQVHLKNDEMISL